VFEIQACQFFFLISQGSSVGLTSGGVSFLAAERSFYGPRIHPVSYPVCTRDHKWCVWRQPFTCTSCCS